MDREVNNFQELYFIPPRRRLTPFDDPLSRSDGLRHTHAHKTELVSTRWRSIYFYLHIPHVLIFLMKPEVIYFST